MAHYTLTSVLQLLFAKKFQDEMLRLYISAPPETRKDAFEAESWEYLWFPGSLGRSQK